jgi:hypothetical protein
MNDEFPSMNITRRLRLRSIINPIMMTITNPPTTSRLKTMANRYQNDLAPLNEECPFLSKNEEVPSEIKKSEPSFTEVKPTQKRQNV